MILCDAAVETINLYVSVIKFLRYEGIVWTGDSLPLNIYPLGDLFQTKVDLWARGEKKQSDAWWSNNSLQGTFQPGKIYDLEMRVEYRLPNRATVFQADFFSIHPKNYRFILDFPQRNEEAAHLNCRLGETRYSIPMDNGWQAELPNGYTLKMTRENDYCSAEVIGATETPFGHRSFPELSFS